jgi:hypothetical protein
MLFVGAASYATRPQAHSWSKFKFGRSNRNYKYVNKLELSRVRRSNKTTNENDAFVYQGVYQGKLWEAVFSAVLTYQLKHGRYRSKGISTMRRSQNNWDNTATQIQVGDHVTL